MRDNISGSFTINGMGGEVDQAGRVRGARKQRIESAPEAFTSEVDRKSSSRREGVEGCDVVDGCRRASAEETYMIRSRSRVRVCAPRLCHDGTTSRQQVGKRRGERAGGDSDKDNKIESWKHDRRGDRLRTS